MDGLLRGGGLQMSETKKPAFGGGYSFKVVVDDAKGTFKGIKLPASMEEVPVFDLAEWRKSILGGGKELPRMEFEFASKDIGKYEPFSAGEVEEVYDSETKEQVGFGACDLIGFCATTGKKADFRVRASDNSRVWMVLGSYITHRIEEPESGVVRSVPMTVSKTRMVRINAPGGFSVNYDEDGAVLTQLPPFLHSIQVEPVSPTRDVLIRVGETEIRMTPTEFTFNGKTIKDTAGVYRAFCKLMGLQFDGE